jgi:flagellar basal-body rod modification protein FlgD
MISSVTSPPSSSATTSSSTKSPTLGQTLGKDDFLKLLITQMRNQDPLNPLDQNQFLAQTAQFTSLEDLQNINQQLSDMKALTQGQSLTQGASLLGKSAAASGRDVSLGLTGASLTFDVQEPGALQLQILDAQKTVVRTLDTSTDKPGQFSVTWDGLDGNGQSMAAGTYHYRVVPEGETIAVAAQGTLTGMTPTANGVVYHLGDAIVRSDDLVAVG